MRTQDSGYLRLKAQTEAKVHSHRPFSAASTLSLPPEHACNLLLCSRRSHSVDKRYEKGAHNQKRKKRSALQKAERLQATLHLLGQAQPHQKTLFQEEGELRYTTTEVAVLDEGLSHSDDGSSDLGENPPETSARAGLDDETAARVSRCACAAMYVCSVCIAGSGKQCTQSTQTLPDGQ
jgi:hypothetical protein